MYSEIFVAVREPRTVMWTWPAGVRNRRKRGSRSEGNARYLPDSSLRSATPTYRMTVLGVVCSSIAARARDRPRVLIRLKTFSAAFLAFSDLRPDRRLSLPRRRLGGCFFRAMGFD